MAPGVTRFTEMLIEANQFDPKDFKNWAFCPGMLFNSPDKWWGDRGLRDFPHEGIDFCVYADSGGRLQQLDEKTIIPVMQDGIVKAMFRDYLGQAVVIEHEKFPGKDGKIVSVYAHTRPLEAIKPGVRVREGEPVATIADTSRAKAKILPHLHLSIGHPSPKLAYDPFVWNMMRDPDLVTLSNPIGLMDWPYQVLDSQNRFCSDI